MAAFSGTAGSVVWNNGSDIQIATLQEWSLDFSMSPPETTSFGENADTYTPSVRTATGSFSGNRNEFGSLQQVYTWDTLSNGTIVQLKLFEDSGKYFSLPTCIVTGVSPSLSVKGKGELSVNFQATSEIVYV